MPKYTQANQPMAVMTPSPGPDLGPDALLLVGFTGHEAISQPFDFQLEVIAENTAQIAFERLLGQSITVELELPGSKTPREKKRYFNGICWRISQGEADEEFTPYRMEIVPKLSLLTRKAQSRIFQNVSVKDILQKVLEGMSVDFHGIRGEFHPRDYCVQYRETDFNFACRLMEEEGIYYYFTHGSGNHKMVLANTQAGHADVPHGKEITYQNIARGTGDNGRIYGWEKVQELRSGKYTLWDYSLEKPHDRFQAAAKIAPSVMVGAATHLLNLKDVNDKLEIYDYPGEFAQRFDGVQQGGGDHNGEVEKISKENERTVAIRMQEEALRSLLIQGASNCRHLVSGHLFVLSTLPEDAKAKLLKAEGKYVLTSVMHTARNAGGYRSNNGRGFTYHNTFTCIPFDLHLPFRPPRTTPKPIVPGTQTAIVVGSGQEGEEILTDKYGRVKVQFHWDRPGVHNTWKDQARHKYSSCWVQVAQVWAGKRWGASFWPRIGQEVVVGFVEGDMDQPIIIGSVYNAEQKPPYLGDGVDPKHKHDNKVSGIKSNSTPGGLGFNELRFDDTKDKEQVFIHAERNMDVRVKHDGMERVIHDRHLIVGWEKDGQKGGDQLELVYQDKHLTVERDQFEHIKGNLQLLVGKGEASYGGNMDIVVEKKKSETIEGDNEFYVKGNRIEKIDGITMVKVGQDQQQEVTGDHALRAKTIYLKGDTAVVIEAGTKLTLKVGGNFVDIHPGGVDIRGMLVNINSGGSAGNGSGPNVKDPQQAKEANPAGPTLADDAKPGYKSAPR